MGIGHWERLVASSHLLSPCIPLLTPNFCTDAINRVSTPNS
ncbi:hypothetical protein GXM_01076 [Nostoc sphaeroides CCNUC1]|uniref:Uncharacterized protein n=1 Tax=Nostoc sphaeroides CCNUC1 TaxID=2653204 RepID=A0A5P8VT80_9NOSO|nr:hypothetical protein GXM_01076 [Nostoc sphaeroides CCNUC1]